MLSNNSAIRSTTKTVAPDIELGTACGGRGGAGGIFKSNELASLLTRSVVDQPIELSLRQKLALSSNVVGMTTAQAESIGVDGGIEIDLNWLSVNCTPISLAAAELRPVHLFQLGCNTAADLRIVRMDSLHLVMLGTAWTSAAVVVWGRENLVEAFLQTAADAVALAGEAVCVPLGIDQNVLLRTCVHNACAATNVLAQLNMPFGLKGVDLDVLLATEITAELLRTVGVSFEAVAHTLSPSASQMIKLGYKGL